MLRQTLESKVERFDRRVNSQEQLREEMRDVETRLRADIQNAAVSVTTAITTALSAQLEESKRHLRMLFEEYVGRLATIREGGSPKSRRKR